MGAAPVHTPDTAQREKDGHMDTDKIILRFFRDDIEGILITNARGDILYADETAAALKNGLKAWALACPPPREGQQAESWDLPDKANNKSYMVTTSSFVEDGEIYQIHHIVENTVYRALYRDISEFTRSMKEEKEHDSLTGLYNKGKFMAMKRSLFPRMDQITVFNMDVNNLKQFNDTMGHDAGDQLIRKAADSLKAIASRNVIPFRVGGDEFIVAALHLDEAQSLALRRKWEDALSALNELDDGVVCVMACGMAHAKGAFDLEAVFTLADQRMYADKAQKKEQGKTSYLRKRLKKQLTVKQ